MNAVHAMQPGVQRVRFDVELLGCLCNGEPVFTDACKALADHLLEFWVVSCSLVGHEYFLLAARTGLAALYRYTGALTKKPYVTEILTCTEASFFVTVTSYCNNLNRAIRNEASLGNKYQIGASYFLNTLHFIDWESDITEA